MTNNKGEKMNSREKFLAYVVEHGWKLDPDAQITCGPYRSERAHDPHAFIRQSDADPNIVWRADLDYSTGERWIRATGDMLRLIRIRAFGEDRQNWVLNKSATFPEPLRLVTDPADLNVKLPLQKRAELVMANPDLYIWLAAERQHNDREAARQLSRAKSAPIAGVTVSRLEWWTFSNDIVYAAQDLREANGTTDICPLMDKLREHVAALESAITKGDN
jgi:hypothetical protein